VSPTMDEATTQSTLRTGRPLDDRGDPTDAPVLELDPDGRAAALLSGSSGPLVSSPGAGTWATLLERPDDGETDRPVLLQWLGPDAAEPPPHVHPVTETFEAVEGPLTLTVEESTRQLTPGERVTVDAGREHGFGNDTDDVVAFRAELPSMRTVETLYSVWGLDHEGAFGDDGAYGRPGPLHALLLSAYAYDETVTTALPLSVQKALWATVGRLARRLGYRAVDERFLADAFWTARVEQPDM